jgi:hypothetical protein
MDGFAACFASVNDPRTGNAGRHDLREMLMIAQVRSFVHAPTTRYARA